MALRILINQCPGLSSRSIEMPGGSRTASGCRRSVSQMAALSQATSLSGAAGISSFSSRRPAHPSAVAAQQACTRMPCTGIARFSQHARPEQQGGRPVCSGFEQGIHTGQHSRELPGSALGFGQLKS